MRLYSTIGKNYETTAKYIDNPISEWYVPWPALTMTCQQMQDNFKKLADQIGHWGDVMTGANNKEMKNLTKVVEVQSKKLDAYEQQIPAACAVANPVDNEGDDTHTQAPAPGGGALSAIPKWMLYAGGALLLIKILKG